MLYWWFGLPLWNVAAGCQVSTWSVWTECSKTCGAATRTRRRAILRGDVSRCPELMQTHECQTQQMCADSDKPRMVRCKKHGFGVVLFTQHFDKVSANPFHCVVCPAGRFAESSGGVLPWRSWKAQTFMFPELCTACPSSYYSVTGSSSCTHCSPGTHNSVGSATCIECKIGRFSDSCFLCPEGYFNDEKNARNCKACSIGRYSNDERSACPNRFIQIRKVVCPVSSKSSIVGF